MIGLAALVAAADRERTTWPARDGAIQMGGMTDSHLFYTLALLMCPTRGPSMPPRCVAKLPALRLEALRRLQ